MVGIELKVSHMISIYTTYESHPHSQNPEILLLDGYLIEMKS